MTCSGITAVRQSQFGHPEVAAGTEISQENYFPAYFHGVQSFDTPRLRARGGSWEERSPKTKVKVMVMVKVRAKVVWSVHHHPRTDP
jgi:hypothetical protein